VVEHLSRHLVGKDPLSTGEHWYTPYPLQWTTQQRVVDILQPDIKWCGGLTTCQQIGAAAGAAGIDVILHGGGNNPYGQHFSIASPAVPWLECFIGTPPGVPIEEGWRLPGQAIPKDRRLTPNDTPGFSLEIPLDWLVPFQ
jgi:L-rhamnonate dehydratase